MQIAILKKDEIDKYYDRFLKLLVMCNEDFYPPLSARGSTTQANFKNGKNFDDGVKRYCDAMVNQNMLVAVEEEDICGFISFKEDYTNSKIFDSDKPNIYISTVLVNPNFRGRKITVKMYEVLLEFCQKKNIFTRTWSGNDAHTKILLNLGFSEHKRIENDRAVGVDTVYFIKKDRTYNKRA